MSVPTFDLYLIQSATQRAKDYADEHSKRVQRLLVEDDDNPVRIDQGYCKWCWFRRATSLAGQAFTSYVCWRCEQEASHHNTAVPRLCPSCVKETELCCSCCGDLKGRMRKKVP